MTDTRWWRGTPSPAAEVLLFCLPHAGAGAAAYREWAFGPRIGVEPVLLPGRETRITEDPTPDPTRVAAAIAQRADRPYAIFGHSMGARLGFHAVRELRRMGAPMPLRLFVSAARPPDTELDRRYSHLADDELFDAVTELGGMPAELAEHDELRALVLPILRADLAWLEACEPADEAPLPVPIVALSADGDSIASPEYVAGWARHTSAGFRQVTFAGGHFYLEEHLPAIIALIRDEI